MTRDHDMKRAIRARMKVTGEQYTAARSALVAPGASRAPASETSESQGGVMAAVQSELLEELDQRGFAVLRSFIESDAVARLMEFVNDIVSAAVADKQEEDRARRAAGETGWIDVWHPGEAGFVVKDVTGAADVASILRDQRLLEIARSVKGAGATLRKIRVIASMPGYGHQGFHPDSERGRDDRAAPSIGSWDDVAFFLVISPHRAETGTIRALPGSHRTPPHFAELGSAMPPHPDEVRIEADPGDLFVYSAQLWKSSTFNGGHEPLKGLWIGC